MNKQPLRIKNAQSALLHFFHYHYCTNRTIKEINDETVQNFLDEMNDLVVGAVMSETTKEEKIFLHGRYCCNESFIELSLKLHIHPNGLQRWRDRFLNEIAALLNFRLIEKDLYSRNKIEVLVYVLKRYINFYEHYNKEAKEFLEEMKIKYEKYHKLLDNIYSFLYAENLNSGDVIIKIKILNPNISFKEMRTITGNSYSTIYHHINSFKEKQLMQLEQIFNEVL